MITTKADLWNTRIDLFLALGGDWSLPGAPETRTDALPDAPGQDDSATAEIDDNTTEIEVSP